METPRTIDALSVTELKSLAYDELVKLQTAQNNLVALNKALEYRQSQLAATSEAKTETPVEEPIEA